MSVSSTGTIDLLRSCADPGWDFGDPRDNNAQLLELVRNQCHHAFRTVPFWRSKLRAAAELDPARFDIKRIPLTFKQELCVLSPYDLLPTEAGPFHMCRGTGGTTGTPTNVFWTSADWTAAIQAICRFLEPLTQLRPLVAWNGYHQGHAAGPSFDDVIRALGGTPLPRHFRSRDVDAVEEIRRMRANVIVITPQTGSGKGGSLEDLLAEDHSFLSRLQIKALLLSSTSLTFELLEEIRRQGVSTVVNLYGCSEAFPAAISCPADPLTFHLCPGPNFVEIVDDAGMPVQAGERGLVVVSRVAAVSGQGLGVSQGTQLLRYAMGDSAKYIEGACACGRTTRRISDIQRVMDHGDRLSGGCEQWE